MKLGSKFECIWELETPALRHYGGVGCAGFGSGSLRPTAPPAHQPLKAAKTACRIIGYEDQYLHYCFMPYCKFPQSNMRVIWEGYKGTKGEGEERAVGDVFVLFGAAVNQYDQIPIWLPALPPEWRTGGPPEFPTPKLCAKFNRSPGYQVTSASENWSAFGSWKLRHSGTPAEWAVQDFGSDRITETNGTAGTSAPEGG
ncbi:hypothetical protein C8F04DRAFT_1175064 [Mycena alexandri]|uniref:Uncharacterized protein n=1 Tax=Mycena alexandri TaxID=1745969 RepID=A0AAD6XD55_9AGAR|nr:hypothetical protein C8F04DRAFT_1175064 [Mycena alexandri]